MQPSALARAAAALALSLALGCGSPADAGPPPTIIVEPSALLLIVESSTAVEARVTGRSGAPLLTWRSVDPGVATVEPAPPRGAIVRGVGVGTARLVVQLAARPDVADTVPVTVAAAPCLLLGPSVTPNQLDLAVGAARRLAASLPRCGPPPSDTTFAWRSLQPEVATVDSTGLVTGVAPGVATIRVSPRAAPAVVGTATVTVR